MPTLQQRQLIGQLFVVGFHGREINDDITSLIHDYGVGAVILFKRNILDATQLSSLCLSLQTIARDAGHLRPLLIGIDQEGGLVTRISPPLASQQPGPMTLAAAGSLESALQSAAITASTLRHFGINTNYAPIADINSEPLNPVIGVRSPGDDPNIVSDFALACARGMRAHRVVPCIKHFPGHGDTAVDSHYGLPVIDKSRDALDALELVPFRRAVVEEGIEMVMTAHISMPRLSSSPSSPSSSSSLPATLSPDAIAILREEWSYDGVVVTDCLEMDGVRAAYGTVEASLMALHAGVDSLMICHTYSLQTAAIDRLCDALASGHLSPQRVDTSLRRIASLKDRYTSWHDALSTQPSSSLAAINQRGASLARQLYADAATLVRSQPGLLPLSSSSNIVFVSPGPDVPIGGAVESGTLPTRVPWIGEAFGDVLGAKLDRPHHQMRIVRFTSSALRPDDWRLIDTAEVVVLATRNARESRYQRELGLDIARRRRDRPFIAIATCAPYDFLDDKELVGTYLAVYEPTVEAFASAVDVLFGTVHPKGKLPVHHVP